MEKANTAFLFPGQGSQMVGMGLELYEASPAARQVFHEVDQALGFPLSRLMFYGPEEELRKTVNAQPAIMAVSLASLRALEEALGPDLPRPSFLAGHSLGEYTALVASGVLSLRDGIRLARERGRLMQEACQQWPGGMVAVIGLEENVLQDICRETGTEISNVNSPRQTVVSGRKEALAQVMKRVKEWGAQAIPLKVSGAFHSTLMAPAREGLRKAVARLPFRPPSIPIIANVTGTPLTTVEDIKEELVEQLVRCVQWKSSVAYMISAGVSHFVEVEPGRVLSGLVRQIDRRVHISTIGDLLPLKRASRRTRDP